MVLNHEFLTPEKYDNFLRPLLKLSPPPPLLSATKERNMFTQFLDNKLHVH